MRGKNTKGQIGKDTSTSSGTYFTNYFTEYDTVIAQQNNTIAFDENGDLWMWGNNANGQIGDGTTENKSEPLQITGKSYKITLNTNGGTINSGDVSSYWAGATVTLPTDVTKEGYTFGGWYESSSFSGNAVAQISSTDTGDKIFYAKWTANTASYTVKHYKQDTSLRGYSLVDTENKTGTVGAVAVPVAKTYTGFTKNSSKSDVNGTVLADGSLALEVYYDRNSYTVTLNTNSGIINSGNITSYTYGIGVTLPTDVTKTGYTFGGWYENSSFSGSAVTSISTTDTGNKDYYAKWTINQYTVTFKDGTTTAKTETVDYGKGATAPSLTKAGYTLSWDKEFSNITEDTTVNAVWTANTNTTYKVEHYKQNTTLDGYELVTEDTENLSRNNRYDCYSSSKNIYRIYRKYNI